MANKKMLKFHGILAMGRHENGELKLGFSDIFLSTIEPITLEDARALYNNFGVGILEGRYLTDIEYAIEDYNLGEEYSGTEEYTKEMTKLLKGKK